MTTPDDERALTDWSARLAKALQILDLKVDHDLLLKLADETSRSITPSGGPISTFIVGYAAGLASTSGEKEPEEAVKTAASTAFLVIERTDPGEEPTSEGWHETAQ